MLRSPLKSGNLSYSLLCMERVYCSSPLPLGQTREDDQIIVCIVLQFLSPLYSYSSCIMRNKTLYAECGILVCRNHTLTYFLLSPSLLLIVLLFLFFFKIKWCMRLYGKMRFGDDGFNLPCSNKIFDVLLAQKPQ